MSELKFTFEKREPILLPGNVPTIAGQPKAVGWWKLPNSEFSIATYTKPNWITRGFMRVVGWKWKEGENP